METTTHESKSLIPSGRLELPSLLPGDGIVDAFLAGRKPTTLAAYAQDMRSFATFLGLKDNNDAARMLLTAGGGRANALVDDFKKFLIGAGHQPASINRRLATLRSLTKLARLRGICTFTIEVENVKVQKYRDTKGPQRSGYNRLQVEVSKREDAKGLRDKAILTLLHDLALRRNEVIQLNIEDVDLEQQTVQVLGKGRSQKETLSLPASTTQVLSTWMEVRLRIGEPSGALFINLHRAPSVRGTRITGPSLYRIVRNLGEKTNQKVRPHAIRHTAITEAVAHAQAAGMDLTKVLQFSRHADLKTLQIYIDQHENLQGKIANMVAG